MKIDEIIDILTSSKTSISHRFVMASVLVDAITPLNTQHSILSNKKYDFYKYYKQGALGNECRGPRPNILDYGKYLKWTEWNKASRLSKEEAQQKYIDLGLEVLEELREESDFQNIISNLSSETLAKKYQEKLAGINTERKQQGQAALDTTSSSISAGTPSSDSALSPAANTGNTWTPLASSFMVPSAFDLTRSSSQDVSSALGSGRRLASAGDSKSNS